MAEPLKPDLCVIGAGAGGLSVAAAAAAFGVPVVLVEKGAMGGDCLHHGCVPSKAMLASAGRAAAMAGAGPFGVASVDPQVNFARVADHIAQVIAGIAPNDSVERFTGLGVRVIQAQATFKDRRTLVAGDHEIQARRFVIATGSSPLVPDLDGLEEVPWFTNETIFANRRKPGHLIIIGAGATGMELAQAHRRLGSAVTLVEAGERPLAGNDPEAVRILLDRIMREGVEVRTGVTAKAVSGRQGAIRLAVEDGAGAQEQLRGTHLLIAAGRVPNIGGLELGNAGIAHGPDGIKVDRGMRTSNRRIYAIGDVTGGPRFTHAANHQAGLVIRSALFRIPARARHAHVPAVVYTEPELAHVGLGEEEARRRHKAIRILRWPFSENDRARAMRQPDGMIKVVTTPRGRILGATIVGAHAGELIGVWTLALAKGMSIGALAGHVVPYPTLGEVSRRVAMSFYQPGLTKPWIRRIIGVLRMFG